MQNSTAGAAKCPHRSGERKYPFLKDKLKLVFSTATLYWLEVIFVFVHFRLV